MPKKQLVVADQRRLSGGHESCGYHTFKNSLLSLMRIQGLIDQKQYETLLQDKPLFEAIFKKCKRAADPFGNKDISYAVMLEMLVDAKLGLLNFTAQGLSPNILQQLDITQDGTGKISVINFSTDMIDFGAELGQFGGDEVLMVAASIAKLARTKTETGHVFALGINNQHWVTAMVKQDAKGERSWEYMDSYGNQGIYYDRAINAVEKILTKDEPALRDYLYNVYDGTNGNFNNRYEHFFNKQGKPLHGRSAGWGRFENEEKNTLEFFVVDKENLADFTTRIETRFSFMETAKWLDIDDKASREHVEMKKVYTIANFIIQNAGPADAHYVQRLTPICKELETTLGIEPPAKAEEIVITETSRSEPVVQITKSTEQTEIYASLALKIAEISPLSMDRDILTTTMKFERTEEVMITESSRSEPVMQLIENNEQTEVNDRLALKIAETSPEDSLTTLGEFDGLDAQQCAAAHAVNHGEPAATESFVYSVVRAIKDMIQGIKDFFDYLGDVISQSIRIKS